MSEYLEAPEGFVAFTCDLDGGRTLVKVEAAVGDQVVGAATVWHPLSGTSFKNFSAAAVKQMVSFIEQRVCDDCQAERPCLCEQKEWEMEQAINDAEGEAREEWPEDWGGAVSTSSRKGYALEALIRDDLKAEGVEAYRPRAGNVKDEGDVKGVRGLTVECKNWTTMKLPQWWRETLAEAEHAGTDLAALVHKRKGKGQADDQWVTMDWRMFKALLRRAGMLPDDDDTYRQADR